MTTHVRRRNPRLKIPKFYLISWCGNFVETHSYRIVSGNLCQSLFFNKVAGLKKETLVQVARNSVETVHLQKISIPGNYLKFRYYMLWSSHVLRIFNIFSELRFPKQPCWTLVYSAHIFSHLVLTKNGA